MIFILENNKKIFNENQILLEKMLFIEKKNGKLNEEILRPKHRI